MEKITKGHPMSQSVDIVKENLETLKRLFPTIVKEGKIDLEELKALLDEDIETNEEYYRFTWAGKNEARREANKPSTATLRPCKEESKNWETTGNIFIEGDNLEVLKLLQKSYASKIKMMYFDPPYNTGNDFIYKDNYSDNLSNYLSLTGQTDEEGKKMSTNTESAGRYHSNWLNMMYPRLKLARNLLTDDGIVFISIDDNEVNNLRKLCDEIFGEDNFIEQICWKNKYGAGAQTKGFISVHEYILCYSKCPISNIDSQLNDEDKKAYKNKDTKFNKRGGYFTQPLMTNSLGDRPNLQYLIFYQGDEIKPNKQWVWSEDRLLKAIENDEVVFNKQSNGSYSVRSKQYLKDENGMERKGKPLSVMNGPYTQEGTSDIVELFENNPFGFVKPVSLIEFLFSFSINNTFSNEGVFLDFFAGSATTAHAVMRLNSLDNGDRKFVCVQLPEPTNINSDAYKAGYKNIAAISKERIRRAGEKIKKEGNSDLFSQNKKPLDIGFKAFKLDSSNIHAWDGNVENLDKNLFNAVSNIKENRTEEDVLYEILLKYGLDLSVPIEEKEVNNCKIYCIGAGVLFVCLSDKITTIVAEAIGKWKEELQPATCRALFKDNGFADDIAKTNSLQILRQYGIEEANSI